MIQAQRSNLKENPESYAERRKSKRFNSVLEVIARRQGEPAHFSMFTQNLSGGGIKFISRERLKRGEKIEICFFIEDTYVCVKTAARVVWSQICNFWYADLCEGGLEFVNIEDRDRQKIETFCAGFPRD